MEFFVPSHSSRIVTGFWAKHEMKNIAQQPYSPRLAPCDCFLFSKLKNPLRRMRVDSIEVIQNLSLKALKAIPAEAYNKKANFEGDINDLY